jgi:hypothetical protein
VSFDGSAFNADADFERMKVGSCVFRKAVFEGQVDFAAADIAAQLVADGARFQNKEKEANFNSMKVGGAAFFKGAVFEGAVDFVGADFASQFVANGAQFQNKEQGASFDDMKVRGAALFYAAVFEGGGELRRGRLRQRPSHEWSKVSEKGTGSSQLQRYEGWRVRLFQRCSVLRAGQLWLL